MMPAVSFQRLPFSLSLTIATAMLSPSLSALAAATTCYYPDGSPATGDTPCGNGTDVACCGKSAVCLSNGLCMDTGQPYTLARSSCSDITWTSSNCPNYCLGDSTFNKSGISIVLYTYLDSVAEYCCNNIISEDNQAVCAGNYSRIRIPDSSIVPGYAILADYVLANDTLNSTNTTADSSSASSSSSSSGSSNHDAAIGAGVGVPLGVIALASIAWALWERRKLHRLRTEGFAGGAAGAAVVTEEPKAPAGTSPHSPAEYTTSDSLSSQQQQQHTTQPRVLSELGVSGPVELDSRRAA